MTGSLFASNLPPAGPPWQLFAIAAVMLPLTAIWLAFLLWSVDQYLRRYRDVRQIRVPLPSEIFARHWRNMLKWRVTHPGDYAALLRATREEQTDPDLEHARRSLKQRQRLGVLALFAVGVALIALLPR